MSLSLRRGTAPLLVSMPHIGTEIPQELRPRYAERALGTEDADWHLDRLYDFLDELGASVVQPRITSEFRSSPTISTSCPWITVNR